MSLARITSWPRALASAVICAVFASLLVFTPTTAANAVPVTAVPSGPTDLPPPSGSDASGTSQDEVWTEEVPAGYTYLYKGMAMNSDEDVHYSTGGDEIVTVQVKSNDGWQDVLSWTLTYSTVTSGVEAPDSVTVVVHKDQCDGLRMTPMTALVTNGDDESDLYKTFYVTAVRSDNWKPGPEYAVAMRVLDGETRPVEIGTDSGGGYPGTYAVTVREGSKRGTIVATTTARVPSCGSEDPPLGDPMYQGSKTKPKGNLSLLNCHTGRARRFITTDGVKPVTAKTKFLFILNPRKGATKRVVIKVKNDTTPRPKTFKLLPGDKAQLYYKTGPKKKVRLSQLGYRGCGS